MHNIEPRNIQHDKIQEFNVDSNATAQRIEPAELMMESVEAGESYQTSPAVWHREEDLQSRIVPDLHT